MQIEQRAVRSFVLRQGRMTEGQKRALSTLWPEFGIDLSNHSIDFKEIFQRDSNTVLEIGFGMGQSLIDMAIESPTTNFLGVEVHKPGVGRLLSGLEQAGVRNVKAINADAVCVLTQMIPDSSLHGVHIYFPDPWHKKKHQKRRLVQSAFIKKVCQKLRPGGYIHLATDWEDYASHMLEVLDKEALLTKSNTVCKRANTRFEERGKKLGHEIFDFIFVKNTGLQ